MREWKPLKNLVLYGDNYEITVSGEVRNVNGKIKKQRIRNGYLIVDLSLNGKKKSYSVHRLVAIAFIPNPNNLPQVNHKDECKTNNFVDNLEWCDAFYNCNYGTRNERQKKSNESNSHFATLGKKNQEKFGRKVLQLDIKTHDIIAEFSSAKEAGRKTGIHDSNIGQVANKLKWRKSAGGYFWVWKDEYEEGEIK